MNNYRNSCSFSEKINDDATYGKSWGHIIPDDEWRALERQVLLIIHFPWRPRCYRFGYFNESTYPDISARRRHGVFCNFRFVVCKELEVPGFTVEMLRSNYNCIILVRPFLIRKHIELTVWLWNEHQDSSSSFKTMPRVTAVCVISNNSTTQHHLPVFAMCYIRQNTCPFCRETCTTNVECGKGNCPPAETVETKKVCSSCSSKGAAIPN